MTAPDRAVNALATTLMSAWEDAGRRGVGYAGKFEELARTVIARQSESGAGMGQDTEATPKGPQIAISRDLGLLEDKS